MSDHERLAIEALLAIEAGDTSTLRTLVAQCPADRGFGAHNRELLAAALHSGSPDAWQALAKPLFATLGTHHPYAQRWNEPLFALATRLRRTDIAVDLLNRAAPLDHDARVPTAALDYIKSLLVSPQLLPAAFEPLARACNWQQRIELLNALLESDRIDLLEPLLPFCALEHLHGFTASQQPLMIATERGQIVAIERLVQRGAAINLRCKEGDTALHRALRAPRADAQGRCAVLHALLRLGATPELRDHSQADAFELARRLGDAAAIETLERYRYCYGPRQVREARARGVRDLCFIYDKADGFIYRIATPDLPFMVGGGYDGAQSCDLATARAALVELIRHRGIDLRWFDSFLQRLCSGDEFAYDELLRHRDAFREIGFDAQPNWGC